MIMQALAALSFCFMIMGLFEPDPTAMLFSVALGSLIFCFCLPFVTVLNPRLPAVMAWLLALLLIGLSIGVNWYGCYSAGTRLHGEYPLMLTLVFVLGLFSPEVCRKIYLWWRER
jgi:predicted membrane channel-forming protein YqfA (hemolysin III family)